MLTVRFTKEALSTITADAVVVLAGTDWRDSLTQLDAAFGGQLLSWLDETNFTGTGTTVAIPTFGKLAASVLIISGNGDGSMENNTQAIARAARKARTHGAKHIAVSAPMSAQHIIESAAVGNYDYQTYKMEDAQTSAMVDLTIIGDASDTTRGSVRARWQDWCRDLVNAPAADLYPESLAQEVIDTLGKLPHVAVKVLDQKACKKEGFVGLLAVGQGSSRPGCMIHISYHPPGATKHIAFVGKGVTFDSGGLSLKPSGGMQTMRCDMGGAATVLAATGALAELGESIKIDCIIGAVENMNDGNSYKLGDILRYRNGVTVEIHNTDAEGRLVLADCLLRASEVEGATSIIDVATLTGAAVVALGGDFAGLFTDDDGLAGELLAAATENSEGLWRLPLHAPYKKLLKGKWGKIKNVGGRSAGATTAALFLQNFVATDKQWAHIDIAGSSWNDSGDSTWAAGATGEMVRTLAAWAANK